jgi:serine/threonine protein kinase
LLSEEGWAYLSDFGLARGTSGAPGLTMAGTVMGTPEYMSPEQAQGLDSVGPPTDIYALGVVLYELLTGAFPFQADTPMAMLAARIVHAPTPIGDLQRDLPVAVEDVVMRALARRPDARFASAGAMVEALRSAAQIDTLPTGQPPVSPPAGLPALGETIKMPPPPPPVQTPAPPPQPPASAPIAPPAQPKRRSGWRVLLWIVIGIVLGVILTCVGLIALVLSFADDVEDESRRPRMEQVGSVRWGQSEAFAERVITPEAAPILANAPAIQVASIGDRPAAMGDHPALGAPHPALGAPHPALMDDQSRV